MSPSIVVWTAVRTPRYAGTAGLAEPPLDAPTIRAEAGTLLLQGPIEAAVLDLLEDTVTLRTQVAS